MKINKKFIPLYENGTKTIELRKVNKLQDILNNNMSLGLGNGNFVICNNSRLKEKLVDSETNKEIGSITINGYQVIKNPFNKFNNYKSLIYSISDTYSEILEINKNDEWIDNNYEYLKNYFKDEKEILVLKIESFKGVGNE